MKKEKYFKCIRKVEVVSLASDFYMNQFAMFSHCNIYFFLAKTHVADSLVGSVLVADVRQADRARSGHVVLEADIFVDKEEDKITWL
jgi:hypothetical protein